jgi:hypothetical protein
MSGLGEACSAYLKSLVDYQQSVKYKSTTTKTLWPDHTLTSSKDRWIGPNHYEETQLSK